MKPASLVIRVIEKAEIAGAEPAVRGEGGLVMRRAGAAIARRHIAGDFERPGLARRQYGAALGIDDAQPHAGKRRPLPRHAPIERPIAWRHTAISVALGRAVDVAD